MGSILSVANSVGAIKVGKTAEHANTGHAPKAIKVKMGFYGTTHMQVGTYVDACTKGQKSSVNKDLFAQDWMHDVHHDCLIHRGTGATLTIERNFWVDAYLPGGHKVVARYTRTG